MLLNELMMPQEMGFKDASAGSGITCAAYRGPFPSHSPAQPAPRALVDTRIYSEILRRVELRSPSSGMRLCLGRKHREAREGTSPVPSLLSCQVSVAIRDH